MSFSVLPTFTEEEINVLLSEAQKHGFKDLQNFLRYLTVRELNKLPMFLQTDKPPKKMIFVPITNENSVEKLTSVARRLSITPQTCFKKVVIDPIIFNHLRQLKSDQG